MGRSLIELVLEDRSPAQDLTEVFLTFNRIDRHPPAFAVTEAGFEERVVSSQQREALPISLAGMALERGLIADGIVDQLLGTSLVQDFLGELQPPDLDYPLPDGTGRLVVAGSHELLDLGWEQLESVDHRFGAVPVLRRVSGADFQPPRPLDFPLRYSLNPTIEQDRLADELFDGFVHSSVSQGAMGWESGLWPPDISHHLVRSGSGEEATYVLDTDVPPPRVAVLHLTAAAVDDASAVVSRLLAGGVGAVVVAALPVDAMSHFFQKFYRKLMHNWPLEFCVWAGLAVGREIAGLPLDARVYAVAGGEYAVALSRVPAELSARDVIVPEAVPSRDEPAREPVRGLERVSEEAEWSQRELRASREVWAEADATLRSARVESRSAEFDHANDLEFSSEEHETGALINITETVRGDRTADESHFEGVAAAPTSPRLTNVTVADPRTDRPVAATTSLQIGVEHLMAVQVEPHAGRAQVSAALDESPLEEVFKTRERVELDVVVFTPDSDFGVDRPHQKMSLPKVGSSDPVGFAVTPLREGWCRLRICVYYRNTMLQSLAVEMLATASGSEVPEGPTIRRTIDWVASADLQLLHELPEPLFNVFTNEDNDGTHWIGVFSDKGDEGLPLQSGQMLTFDSEDLNERHKGLTAKLQELHGDSYRYPVGAPPTDDAVISFGVDALKQLAPLAYEVYDYIFESTTDAGVSVDRLDEILAAMATSDRRLISVARTHGKWSLPWAVLYDLHLDVGRPLDHEVCEVFRHQLAANWGDDGTAQPEHADLLDDPVACRNQPTCPLGDPSKADITICPFGFWGFRHELEQPLQHVTETAPDEVPDELQSAAFSQASLIIQSPDDPLRVAAGFYPFPQIESHMDELDDLIGEGFDPAEDRDDVMRLLYDRQGHHLFYFYCHGVPGDSFALQVGPVGSPHNEIPASSIQRRQMHWAGADTPQPLVILVACESTAMRPDTMYGLFDKFRNAKASGLIGAEISIGHVLGRQFGHDLMKALTDGQAVGEVFLQLRHELLRHYNPLGLAFTSYAPATLHVHPDDGTCRWCHDHGLVRSP